MAERSRYSISSKDAGIEDGVLKNKLGITDQKSLNDAETLLLSDAFEYFFSRLEQEGLIFCIDLLLEIHRYFLDTLYTWAGKLRTVNISKDDTLFAPPNYLPDALQQFDRELKSMIPSVNDKKNATAEKLAIIHTELNALHPFREGNGRTIRLFLDLMLANIGYKPIDWQKIDTKKYLDACKQGMAHNHEPLAKLIYKGIRKKYTHE